MNIGLVKWNVYKKKACSTQSGVVQTFLKLVPSFPNSVDLGTATAAGGALIQDEKNNDGPQLKCALLLLSTII